MEIIFIEKSGEFIHLQWTELTTLTIVVHSDFLGFCLSVK